MKPAKAKIRPYILYLLRENLPYLLILAVVAATAIIAPPVMLAKYAENQETLKKLEKEVEDLSRKREALTTTLNLSAETLETDVKIVNALVPDVEDYFSIIYTLEELSKKTNFLIIEYAVNLSSSSKRESVGIGITGVGNPQSFLKFLQEYNFGGGRLITASQIGIDPQKGESIELQLLFYSKEVKASEQDSKSKPINYQASVLALQELKNKVTFVIKEEEATKVESYPVKANPF